METTQVELTKNELEMFNSFKRSNWREKIETSKMAISNIKDDIDAPLHNCVAMLNLLGIETIWSCCGFDYLGQPTHKNHEYGNVYIRCRASESAYKLLLCIANYDVPKNISFNTNPWHILMYSHNGITEFQLKYCGQVDWKNEKSWFHPSSVHFHELPALAIGILEKRLLEFKDTFADRVVMYDFNGTVKAEQTFAWQYLPKKPWIINKDEILESLVNSRQNVYE